MDTLSEKLQMAAKALNLPTVESGPTQYTENPKSNDVADDGDGADGLWCEEDAFSDGSDAGLGKLSELDREWERRHGQFHTVSLRTKANIGYRDGLIAGKEASVQEGFNAGFKQSVLAGYNWGLVRGITSVLVCLPDHLKDRLIRTQEKKDRLQDLYESVQSISTKDALKLFQNDILNGSLEKFGKCSERNSREETALVQISDFNPLGRFLGKLDSLQLESPAIKWSAVSDRKIDG